MKNILCFGDSNTWGYDPNQGYTKQRYSIDERWTGVLQKKLGDEYGIIEEGLNGRTTLRNLDLGDPNAPFLSGREALPMIMSTHKPLDLVMIMLGTNDLLMFDQEVTEIAQQAKDLCEIALDKDNDLDKAPKVLIISPPHIIGNDKSHQFAEQYEAVATILDILFLDAGAVITPSEIDGVHLDADQHIKFGNELANFISQLNFE